MSTNAILFGAMLFILGPIFYLMGEAGHRSFTAFIPSLFGLLIIISGAMAKNPAKRKAAMHGAAGIALLGLLGSLRGLSTWPLILSGRAVDAGLTNSKVLASWSTLLMFVICLIFLVLCIKSFREARRSNA